MATQDKRKLGHLDPSKCVLFVCDIQEKLEKSIPLFSMVVSYTEKLVKTATLFKIPIIVTEQYPKGLGSTVLPIKELFDDNVKCYEKTQFSMVTEDVKRWLDSRPDIDTVILCGLETHVCVNSTVIDLCHAKYNVHLVVDATASRSMLDRNIAIDKLKNIGTHITTTEAIILNLLGGKNHPQFRQVQQLIRDLNPLNKSLL